MIEQRAFYECEKLKSVSFQDGSRLEKIGAECFAESGLKEIVLPESVKEIGVKAFDSCKQLKNVQLNEGLEKLGEKIVINGKEVEGDHFADSAVKRIKLPSTLKRIEK